MVTVIFVIVFCVIIYINNNYLHIGKLLKLFLGFLYLSIYFFVSFLGYVFIRKFETYKNPHFLCCGNERTIFIFDVKKDKIGIVDYKEGINLKNFKLYSPEYIYPTEIPKNFRIEGIIIYIKIKEPCDDFDFFDYIRIET